MAALPRFEPLQDLPRKPASDVKKLGWRGVMKAVGRDGAVVVTHHNEPEAVILSIGDYEAIMQALREANARQDDALEALRQRFDERLSSLQGADAGKRLREVMRKPARLDGKVKAGATH
ncbi:type II toxin-antitoxin system prevent-host-death family antitoxin [Marilutibacter spongiae]|uniref:Antitoxin n=1 Tax=Marilutibacter spongiae TaxID=2025720 RepID=A0A7W3TLN9_9GAMM|nr:type II toxin-antitoxin system prevent-host-death family antitoxin [Lysobacter spongiae]MBB1060593.1 type II toxin-antitoxin system Phd/YefM family antitoxin [Lysobacter spongiae]